MGGLGFHALITILAPGGIVSAAVWLLVNRFLANSDVYSMLLSVLSTDWLGPVVVFVASAIFGTVVASLVTYLEFYCFDIRRWIELKISKKEYYRQWHQYVDSLSETQNPYISRMVTSYDFELRTAAAGLLLAVALALSSTSFGGFATAAVVILFSAALGKFSQDSQRVLAGYRNRRFGKQSRTPR